jgi:RNA-binding protein NOB1
LRLEVLKEADKMAETASPSTKPVHTIVLDAGPIIKNTPPLSTLLAQCDEIITTPSVVNEIRDPDARARVETLYMPFLKQRTPSPKSFNVISEFARKTGDRSVLSRVDIEVLALAYEIECERNGGDWRLRSVPGQKRVNGKPPVKEEEMKEETEATVEESVDETTEAVVTEVAEEAKEGETAPAQEEEPATESATVEPLADDDTPEQSKDKDEDEDEAEAEDEDDAADSDGEWITPTNYKKRLARDESGSSGNGNEPKSMQVATMTTDFAV